MDHILSSLNNRREILGNDSKENNGLLRTTLSYCLNLCVGVLWYSAVAAGRIDDERKDKLIGEFFFKLDKNKAISVTDGSKSTLIYELTGISWNDRKKIKQNVSDAYELNEKLDPETRKLFGAEGLLLLDKCIEDRNTWAHSSITIEEADEILSEDLSELTRLIPLLGKAFSPELVVLYDYDESSDYYKVCRYPAGGGLPRVGELSAEHIRDSFSNDRKRKGWFPRTFYYLDEIGYCELSPFVDIDPIHDRYFVFQQLTSFGKGEFTLLDLFPKDRTLLYKYGVKFEEFCCTQGDSGTEENKWREVNPDNGVVRSPFTLNYMRKNQDCYIEDITDVEKRLKKLILSPSNLICAVWGHGGVGKTACAQHICMELFKSQKSGDALDFAHIVFVTAKDRIYNIATRKIDELSSKEMEEDYFHVNSLTGILKAIFRVWLNKDVCLENEEDIEKAALQLKRYDPDKRMLIVIDDYETFSEEEKKRISDFCTGHLDAARFKVLITTRNRDYFTGDKIKCGELDKEGTRDFLKKYMVKTAMDSAKETRRRQIEDYLDNTKDGEEDRLDIIYKGTGGNLVFICVAANYLAERGFSDSEENREFLKGISDTEEAVEFLFGRALDVISKDAKNAFIALTAITNQETLGVDRKILDELLSTSGVCTSRDKALEELENWKIIERDGETARLTARNLLKIMDEKYDDPANKELVERLDKALYEIVKNTVEKIDDRKNQSSSLDGNIISDYEAMISLRRGPLKFRSDACKRCATYIKNRAKSDWDQKEIEFYKKHLYFHLPNAEDSWYDYIYKLWSLGRHDEAVKESIRFFQDPQPEEVFKKKHKITDYIKLYALRVKYDISYAFERYTPDPASDNLNKKNGIDKRKKTEYLKLYSDYASNWLDECLSKISDLDNDIEAGDGEGESLHQENEATWAIAGLCRELCMIDPYNKHFSDWVSSGKKACNYLLEKGYKEGQVKQIGAAKAQLDAFEKLGSSGTGAGAVSSVSPKREPKDGETVKFTASKYIAAKDDPDFINMALGGAKGHDGADYGKARLLRKNIEPMLKRGEDMRALIPLKEEIEAEIMAYSKEKGIELKYQIRK